MKPSSYLMAMLLAPLPLSAHSDSLEIEECKRIEDQTQRLDCYDNLFQRAAMDQLEISDTEPTVQKSPKVSSDSRRESEAISKFGAEQIEVPPVTFIEARLVGEFNGWTGKTLFTLDNGQVWRQTNNYIRDYAPRDPIPAPKVTISKGLLGSYNLQIEGVKRIVQVKRVK